MIANGLTVDAGKAFSTKYIARLRRRWTFILLVAMLIFVPLACLILSLKPVYRADGAVRVDGRSARIVGGELLVSPLELDAETVQSEIQVLRSTDLAAAVVDRLELQKTAEFAPTSPGLLSRAQQALNDVVLYLLPSIAPYLPPVPAAAAIDPMSLATLNLVASRSVEPAGRSRVILLSASSENPNRAAAIVNAFIDIYLAKQLSLKASAARDSEAVLLRQIESMRGEVAAAEEAVETYRRSMGMYQLNDTSIAARQLAALNDSLTTTTSLRQEAEAKLQQIKNPLGVGAVSEALNNRLLQDLNTQQATLREKQAELSARFGPNHPAIGQIAAQMREADDKIAQELNKVASSLRSDVAIQRAREVGLTEQIGRLQNDVGKYDQGSVRLRALQRVADADRVQLEQLLKRQQEVRALATEQTPDGSVVSVARVPVWPSFPQVKPMLAVAGLASLCLASLITLMAELRRKGVWSSDEIRDVMGVTCVGMIPKLQVSKRYLPSDYAEAKPRSNYAEAIRFIRAGVDSTLSRGPCKVVLITSVGAREGKTSLAISLGRANVAAGLRTLVIDCDLRHPTLHKMARTAPAPGLADLVKGEVTVSGAVYRDKDTLLDVMPAGLVSDPGVIAGSTNMQFVLANLRFMYQVIIIDTAPSSIVSDARVLAHETDMVLLLAKWSKTPAYIVGSELRALKEAGAPVVSIVLSQVDVEEHAHYGYSDSQAVFRSNAKYFLN